jgi:hypothetical protein
MTMPISKDLDPGSNAELYIRVGALLRGPGRECSLTAYALARTNLDLHITMCLGNQNCPYPKTTSLGL